MKIFLAVTKEQALEAAKTFQRGAEQMSADGEGTEIRILGIEVHDTVPHGHLTPRNYPCATDNRLPPGWRDRVKKCGAGRDG